MEDIEKEEVQMHRKEIEAVEQVEADDRQIKMDIDKVERYIQEKENERNEEKALFDLTKKEFDKKDEEYNKAKAKKEAKERLVKDFQEDIQSFQREIEELHESKIEHERVRNNQIKKKDTIDKAIEEGPKKNLKKLQDDIVKL